MKKVLIAMDSFKGSMTSIEAGNAVKAGIMRKYPDWQTVVVPVADGGEGTVDAITYGKKVRSRRCKVRNPLGEEIETAYVWYEENGCRTALLEMSAAAGLTLIPEKKRNPMYTTTYGVGQMIADAIGIGCRDFIIGIGGSATNDAGIGMLQALGYHFADYKGREVEYGAEGLLQIADIGMEDVLRELSQCRFRIACDVTNPLVGPDGCSAVYGPQKGADPAMIERMETGMIRFANLVEHIAQCDMGELSMNGTRYTPGTGAAGGMGYACLLFLNAVLQNGIEIVLEENGFNRLVKDADLVITGEGRMDQQTLMGKTAAGVARMAGKYGKPVCAIAGCFGEGIDQCRRSGMFAECLSVEEMLSEEERVHAMETSYAKRYLADRAAKQNWPYIL